MMGILIDIGLAVTIIAVGNWVTLVLLQLAQRIALGLGSPLGRSEKASHLGGLGILTPWGHLLSHPLAFGYGATFLSTCLHWTYSQELLTITMSLFIVVLSLVGIGGLGEGIYRSHKRHILTKAGFSIDHIKLLERGVGPFSASELAILKLEEETLATYRNAQPRLS
jgi:hypothetical protein